MSHHIIYTRQSTAHAAQGEKAGKAHHNEIRRADDEGVEVAVPGLGGGRAHGLRDDGRAGEARGYDGDKDEDDMGGLGYRPQHSVGEHGAALVPDSWRCGCNTTLCWKGVCQIPTLPQVPSSLLSLTLIRRVFHMT